MSEIVCQLCDKPAKSWRGLHKHLSASHAIKAVTYYGRFPGELRRRLGENIEKRVVREHLGECWVWTGLLKPRSGDGAFYSGGGYGRMRVAGLATDCAHRISYWAHTDLNDVRDLDNLVLLHMCDNPPCINPAHLTPGTVAENNQDRAAKGRSARTLSDEDVLRIKERISWGWSLNKIHLEYGVPIGSLAQIRDGRSFAHVHYDAEIPF